jgi:hypothetical protein
MLVAILEGARGIKTLRFLLKIIAAYEKENWTPDNNSWNEMERMVVGASRCQTSTMASLRKPFYHHSLTAVCSVMMCR